MVIIDSSVLITAYRNASSEEAAEIRRLVLTNEAATTGLVVTEILRGTRTDEEFNKVRQELFGLQMIESSTDVWVLAGRVLFDLHERGEVIPLPDAIIAAHALEGDHAVYSTDPHFSRVLGLRIHTPRPA